MATRQVLAELAAAYERRSSCVIAIESVGGVDAAARVSAGEAFDVVFLASDAIDKLVAGGRVIADSKVDLVRSPVAVAVRAGAPRPGIGTEEAVKRKVDAALAFYRTAKQELQKRQQPQTQITVTRVRSYSHDRRPLLEVA